MHKSFASLPLIAALFAGCVSVAPPPNRSSADPSDASAPEASARRFRPNLVATTKVYLDPSAGADAQKMEHGNMQGMGGMEGMKGMDHSQMQGMENKQPPAGSPPQSGNMPGMDHSKMPGMGAQQPAGKSAQQPAGMEGMDHSKMPEMTSQPQSKEALEMEMKKTSDEMKKLSDELKKKSDAAKPADKTQRRPLPSPQPDHGQMQHQGMSPAPSDQPQGNVTYTCVMHPEVKSDKTGKCPKCGMKLMRKSSAQ